MWKAINKLTGKEYTLTDEQKSFYERDPGLTGKYKFSKAVTPRPVAGAKEKSQTDSEQTKKKNPKKDN